MKHTLSTVVATTLAAATATAAATRHPNVCVTYFNFTDAEKSDTYFGALRADGSIAKRGNLGYRLDPQGRLTVGDSHFSFTVRDNSTAGQGFGCCDDVSLLTVDKATGAFSVASIDAKGDFGVGSKTCGKYGCGILSFAGVDDKKLTTVGWLEPLVPQPPPSGSSEEQQLPQPNPALEGVSLVEFNLATGDITPLRPFAVDLDNMTATEPMDAGMVSLAADTQDFWFVCNPQGDPDVEGVCMVSATASKEPAEITILEWASKTYTITAMSYSKALSGPVVLAQKISGETSPLTNTQIFFADPAHPEHKQWASLLDLGDAKPSLHQATISPCGKYLLLELAVGKDPNYPTQDIVVVDLLNKKEVQRIPVPHSQKDISVLAAMTC